ncbi:MAG: DNA gyrase inhibitor YacG [Alphaproteobacteria bacterium]|nr:DNA gyrase inhibitor YacG [Alphaproteobacteria bacterium]
MSASVAKCPICRARPAEPLFRPFCSKRCADVDLGRWLGGGYSIPAETDADPDGGMPAARKPDEEE